MAKNDRARTYYFIFAYVVCLKYIIIPSITVNESFVSFDNVPPAPSPEDVPTMYG